MRPGVERLQVWAVILPLLKCAVCPACLSLYGGIFAGLRAGAGGVRMLPTWLLLVALGADLFILGAAFRRHHRGGPLVACCAGAAVVLFAHWIEFESLELVGLSLLMATGLWNWWILRKHHTANLGSCSTCGHDHHNHHNRKLEPDRRFQALPGSHQ